MSTNKTEAQVLRKKAELLAHKIAPPLKKDISPEKMHELLQELQIHQIELEMQNEELNSIKTALNAERMRYWDLYNFAPIGYCSLDEEGIILQANLTAASLLEITREELLKRLFSAFIFKEDQDIYYLFQKEMIRSRSSESCVLRMLKNDGIQFWAHITATLAVNNDRTELRIVFYDMTKRKEAEIALRESETKYQLLADYAKDCVFLTDINGNYRYLSPACKEIFGYTPEEFIADTSLMQRIIHPEDQNLYQSHLNSLYQNVMCDIEFRIVHNDGTIRWIAHECNAIYDEKGVCFGHRGSHRDITEKKKMEISVIESEAKLHQITMVAHNAIIMIDNNGAIIFWNPSATKLFGYSQEEVMGRNLHSFLAPERFYADYQKGFANFRVTGEGAAIGKTLELAALHKEGYEIPIEISLSAVQLDGIWCGVGIVSDISERKEGEKKLRKSLLGTITAMSMMVEARDPYTAGHQKRVAALSVAIAGKMGMEKDQIEGLQLAAKIHDIGKIQTPAEILTKPSKLSDIEFSLIRLHPEAGYKILKDIEFPWKIADIIRQHHEMIDGSGYPHGLKKDEILLESRILSVADMVEAISSHRPYRAALGIDVALEIITQERGTKLDPDVVDVCISLFKEKEFSFI